MISKSTIKKWNKKFQEANADEKRVIVAKDVIAHIKSENLKPTKGDYIRYMGKITPNFLAKDVQSNFDKIKCKTCALGGTNDLLN